MKIKIQADKNGVCKKFEIDNKQCGKGIVGYEIHHEAGELPIVILKCVVDDFILDNEDNKIYIENIRKKNIFKKINERIKKWK